ncbi:MAG: hypothetical protein HQK69_06975 [Desulfamplus sp.]|nr:hypothetical protein [Desulfamplus sp.]
MNIDIPSMEESSKPPLGDILLSNEEWLMERILDYAKRQGYAAYTSTLKEAWRLSISGLSASIIKALDISFEPLEIIPEENIADNELCLFGIVEAQRHRERGVSLSMFMGLMKYYRQAYIDLVHHKNINPDHYKWCELFINRVFDRIEIGFCVEWAEGGQDNKMQELQINNRLMTNEKNRYLTIFESIPNPVIIINRAQKVDSLNLAASRLFKKNAISGSQYYCLSRDRQLELEQCIDQEEAVIDAACFGGCSLDELLPWLKNEVEQFHHENRDSMVFEKTIQHDDNYFIYRVKFSKNLDISGKFGETIIILEDITSLKKALDEVKTLKGFIPICANCKNIRDDKGFWQQVERYIADRSEAEFSHSICPECVKKLYPDFDI